MTDDQELVRSVWPEWELTEHLGAGSYGDVYSARRDRYGVVSTAAIKIIRIDSDADGYGLKGRDAETLMGSIAGEAIREIRMMEAVKGYSNIVGIDDHQLIKGNDGEPWIILIRMELLIPLFADLETGIDEAKVLRIGRDLCQALEVCQRHRIVHRDIKPENVFVNADGVYKLGDFGVARRIESTTSRTRIGTRDFMAPEVYNGTIRETDFQLAQRADIYSLGLLLYWLINNRRQPFLDQSGPLTAATLQNAFQRKMNGEAFPVPAGASPALAKIILKACAFKPEDRYEDATSFLRALEGVVAEENQTSAEPESAVPNNRRRRIPGICAALALVAVLAMVGLWLAHQTSSAGNGTSGIGLSGTEPAQGISPTGADEDSRGNIEDLTEDIEKTTGDIDSHTVRDDSAGSDSASVPIHIQIGDIVTYGRYEQDADESNGPEEIEWIVLDIESDGRMLLFSQWVLEAMAFNETQDSKVKYETSSIRRWLNETFLETAFDKEEQDALLSTQSDTDPVLLLNSLEISRYLNSEQIEGHATAYAVSHGAHQADNGTSWWWTANVDEIDNRVTGINFQLVEWPYVCTLSRGGVRPAIYLPVSALTVGNVK